MGVLRTRFQKTIKTIFFSNRNVGAEVGEKLRTRDDEIRGRIRQKTNQFELNTGVPKSTYQVMQTVHIRTLCKLL